MKLFTVPEKEKISETHMLRVLISTVCTIALCLSCLVSTTWAWYNVSITSEGNVLQIDTWPAAGTVEEIAEETTEEATEAAEETTEAAEETTEAAEETTEAAEETTEAIEETTEAVAETTQETA